MRWQPGACIAARERVDAEVKRLCGADVGKQAGTLAGTRGPAGGVAVALAGCSRGA
jgi:hypothetical protein